MEKNPIVEQLNNLYILYRKKFLIMDKNGYKEIRSTNDKKINLTDVFLLKHLQQKQTIGVFAGTIFTKFICFDVDIKNNEIAKWVVYKIINSLIEFGIPQQFINVSISGNKGYHIEIFFNKPIENNIIQKFFKLIIYNTDIPKIQGDVEMRPTFKQGVKIPLGKHFKTNNVCWYCNYKNKLKPIKTLKHILTIQQIDSEFFIDLFERANDIEDFTIEEKCEVKKIVEKIKPLQIYQQNINEEFTIEEIKKLKTNGLITTGRRHNSLLKISKYNKHIGMNLEENKEDLINWLKIQNTNTYTTKWDDCLIDIDWIVDWVYKNNASIVIRKTNIKITKNEIQELLKLKGSSQKFVFYAMLIHSKRYANKQGKFYMTGTQLVESTGLSNKTVWSIIKQLEEQKIITVFRSDISVYDYKNNKPVSKPNEYVINISTTNIDDNNTFKICEDNSCINCLSVCLNRLINDKELRIQLTRREYDKLINKIDLVCEYN